MNVPPEVRKTMCDRVSDIATEIGWGSLAQSDRSAHYKAWIDDPQIGGVLTRYMPKDHIRTYIKETIMKRWARAGLASDARPLRALGIPENERPAAQYTRPHGCRLADGRIICWGRARDWKQVLMALHERTFTRAGAVAFGVVLLHSGGRFDQENIRSLVEDAARRLGAQKTVWLLG